MSILNQLASIKENSKKRVGRGYGSGKGGHTAGHGTKGQGSRGGSKTPLWFEGGQLPLVRRLPMLRGKGRFNVVNPTAQLTLSELNNLDMEVVTLAALIEAKIIDSRFKKAKIIKSGTISRKVTVEGIGVTAGARQEIEKAGGSVK